MGFGQKRTYRGGKFGVNIGTRDSWPRLRFGVFREVGAHIIAQDLGESCALRSWLRGAQAYLVKATLLGW